MHPAYLDGAFQLLAHLAPHDQKDTSANRAEIPAFLPVRIDRLELWQPHTRVAFALAAAANAGRRSGRSMRADFSLYDDLSAPIAIAHGVRFRAVAVHAGTAQRARWITARAVPMPRRDPHCAVPLPALGELAHHCAARLHTAERVAARRRFSQEFEPLLDALCASFGARGLRELAGDQPIEPRALIESGRIAASSAPMLRNLLQLLVEDGVVQPIASQWLWRTEVALPKPEDIWMSLIADYPEYASLTARVGAAGLHLAERLRAGTLESAVRAAHPDSVSAWADGCTHEEAAGMMEALSDVIRSAAAVQPAHARLRVLRFVGAFPADGLPLVPEVDADRCDMVIGTASQAVLDDLRGRWPAIDTLECRIVDLDHDPPPEPEGVVKSSGYDIVVLGEGVADAPDPALRLMNARRLLLDDGRLVILERHASRAADLMFGLESLWWQGSDRVGRAFAPAPTGSMAGTPRAARVRVGRGSSRYPGGPDRALRVDRASGQRARRARPASGDATATADATGTGAGSNMAHRARCRRLFRRPRAGSRRRPSRGRPARRDGRGGADL